jgi:hypothetical protein
MIPQRPRPALTLALALSVLWLILPAGLSAVVAAQATPDLTGTWTLDPARSDPAPAAAGRGGRGGAPNQLVITKTDTELTVSQGGAGNYIYNLDGSERSGPPGGETKSTISWSDGKLVVSWKREFFAGPDRGYVTSSGKDVYTVAGNVLTIERMSATPPQAPQTRKTVYIKTS